ncbi:MAG: DNA-directed RNA polymerase subunit beta' [bacterium]
MDFNTIQIKLASPDTIRNWSRGEVTKAETINYRTQKPEPDGLFCERIFGPVHDYECSCGKYKGIRYRGILCEHCKVEVGPSKMRRDRMGHVNLAAKVVHIWYYKVPPSKIGLLLDLSVNELERIIYYESYIVIDPGNTDYKKGSIISEKDYQDVRMSLQKMGEEGKKEDSKQDKREFTVGMGGDTIYNLLKELDMEELSTELRTLIKVETSAEKRKKLLSRLSVVEGLREAHIKPEWGVLEVIPVIPADLRPLVGLEGGRYANADLNDLYRRVITRNNRLKNLRNIKAPEVIIKNECRLLQEAVDALFDNLRRQVPVKGKGDRPLKSLSDALRGKQGRFRKNLLGKRVDYSGRSVIVVDPELKLYECGVPKAMAVELFKPFIIRELEKEGYAQTVKVARRLLEEGAKEVWEILERIIQKHPVLLNRAPTLHRLSVQAFFPKLVEGKALRISPLICEPFNADFDGDTMSIHVPLSVEAQMESLILILSANNILSPSNGKPLSVPIQDAVIGIYWLTKEKSGEIGEGKVFDDINAIEAALNYNVVTFHTKIKYLIEEKKGDKVIKSFIDTTPGRVILNQITPEELGFMNKTMDRKGIGRLISDTHKKIGNTRTVKLLDDLKDMGYKYATKAGLTIGIDDMVTLPHKATIVQGAYHEVERVNDVHKQGQITESERYNTVIDIWTKATTQIENETLSMLKKDKNGFNPLYMMASSGARGNMDQVRQIVGNRGLMTRPRLGGKVGEIIETPINSNFKEGLNVLEYFISTHGARKGLSDTALKTAQAGHLTRKLVDVAQDVIITEEDCGTIMGVQVKAIKEEEKTIESLADRIKGSSALEDVINPITSQIIVFAGSEITDEKAKEIEECGIERVTIRSVLSCESKTGICRKCYGRDLSAGRLVEIGEPVGVIAAQSIGEPGTQLTLRTFHIGGIATRIIEEYEMTASFDGQIKFENLVISKKKTGENIVIQKDGKMILTADNNRLRYKVPYGAIVVVDDGGKVAKDTVLFKWDPYSIVILSEIEGEVRYHELKENLTYRLEYDERTGRKHPVVVMHRKIHPTLEICDAKGKVLKSYPMPAKAHILIPEGSKVNPGDLLAKIPRDTSKTRDITGGLPRVVELFEARHPKEKAIVTEIDGTVEFKAPERGYRIVEIHGTHESRKYRVQYGKHLLVYNGEEVIAGDKLTEGPVDPHDILSIKGVQETQEFLVNQIQEVYRLQGVDISDKHIGIIVRQMLSRIRIKEPGDTSFVESQIVDKIKLKEENEKLVNVGGKGATFEPILVGVTQAILTVESFISAASFQETTRVLAEAAFCGKKDRLRGIKENVILGSLIPAGTGMKKLRAEPVPVIPIPAVEKASNIFIKETALMPEK